METFELNIGLNNNSKSVQDILAKVFKTFGQDLKGFRIEEGEWKGEKEETLVIKGVTEQSQLSIITGVAYIADDTTQECIALSMDSMDLLVYQTFWKGKRIKFSEEHFIRYEVK